jgi:hypothetical protein
MSRCSFATLVAAALLSVVAAARAQPAGFKVLAEESAGSLVAGAIGMVAGGLGVLAADRVMSGRVLPPTMGMAALYPFGCMSGTGLVGRWTDQRGKNWAALAGALVGMGVGVTAMRLIGPGDAGVFFPLVLTPAGAVAGYNLSRPGMLLSGRRVLPGGLGVRMDADRDGNEVTELEVRLLNVRF